MILQRRQIARAPAAQVRFVRLRRESTGLLFVLPTVLVMLAIIGYPLLETLRLSVSQVQLGQDSTPFIGLTNYADVLGDRVFATAVRNTLVWTALPVVLVVMLGLLAGLLVHERIPGRTLIRSLVLVPWIVPGIVVAVVWKWLYNPDAGYASALLKPDIAAAAFNSAVIAILITLVALVLAIGAGYGFARFRFFGREVLAVSVLFSQLLPASVVLIPLYLFLDRLRLIDTYPALILS